MFIALIWKFDFAPFMVLIIAILNDGMRYQHYCYFHWLQICNQAFYL